MGSCRLRRLTSWKAALLRGALAPRQSRQSHIVSCFRIASPFHTRQKLPSLRATFPRGGEGFMGELLPPAAEGLVKSRRPAARKYSYICENGVENGRKRSMI
jgi:hypothetical protein